MLGHFADGFFGERAGLSGYADEHSGLDVAHDIEETDFIFAGERPGRDVGFFARERLLIGADVWVAFDEQSIAIDGVEKAAGLRVAQAGIFHGREEQVGDADSRRAETEHDNFLLGERNAGDVDGGEHGGGGHGGGALDVVVESAEMIAIALEQARGVGASEIFPLQQDVRPAALHGGDEGVDEIVILLAAHALISPTDINRIAQAAFVVGADVEQHGEAMLGVNAAESRVERHFADGNAHPARALVA